MSLDLIPTELIYQIASYLDDQDLRKVLTISRSWYRAFIHLLYQRVSYQPIYLYAKQGKTQLVEQMLQAKINPNRVCPGLGDEEAKDQWVPKGHTPLAFAAVNGHEETIKVLLDRGARVVFRKSDALATAAYEGFYKIVEMLLESDAFRTKQAKSDSMEKAMNAVTGECWDFSIHDAQTTYESAMGHWATMEVLLKNGGDINTTNMNGGSLLHNLANSGNMTPGQLIELGLDPNGRDGRGRTPLHVAAEADSMGHVIEMFLTCEADPNLQDPKGNTPLHIAVAERNDRRSIQAFLNHGADVDIQNGLGLTPLTLVLSKLRGKKSLHLADTLLMYYPDVNIPCVYGNTALHWAMAQIWVLWKSHPVYVMCILRKILKCGADLTKENISGATPEMMVAWNPRTREAWDKLLEEHRQDFLDSWSRERKEVS